MSRNFSRLDLSLKFIKVELHGVWFVSRNIMHVQKLTIEPVYSMNDFCFYHNLAAIIIEQNFSCTCRYIVTSNQKCMDASATYLLDMLIMIDVHFPCMYNDIGIYYVVKCIALSSVHV